MKPRSAKRTSVARVGEAAELRARLERAEQSLELARAESADTREQQRATSEILKVMSGSPEDVQPVFNAIIRSAVRLGDAQLGTLFRLDGEMIHVEAHCNLNAEAEEVFARDFPQPIGDYSPYGRAMLQGKVVNMPDLEQFAFSEASRRRGRVLGTRAVLAVPMLGKERVLGAVAIGRRAAGAFSESCVALLKTFADQAVIAIDNVRLFNETKQALEQQTATAEILQTMSRSLTDLAPVFDTILRNTIRLCEGDVAALWRYDGTYLRFAAHRGGSEQGTAYLREHPLEPGDYNPTPQAGLERRAVHVLDVFAEPRYRPLVPAGMFGTVPNSGTVLAIPLLREATLLGVITIWRHEKRMFNDKHIAMVNTFAAQAVIAIENVRLFNETKEALERQTATAEILKVIASSPSDVQPVFDAVVKQAGRLAGGCSVNVSRLIGEHLHLAAYTPVSAAADEALKNAFPVHIDDVRTIAEAVRKKTSFFVSDFETDPHVSPKSRELMRARGFRSTLYVPILHGHVVHGLMHVSKVEPGPFSPHWIQLLETFGDQVVIAIKNVRLFNETKEALEQQTATAEILRVISSSPTALAPVFDAILKNATELCEAHLGLLNLYEGNRFRTVAQRGSNADFAKWVFERGPYVADAGGVLATLATERRAVQAADVKNSPTYRAGQPNSVKFVEVAGARTFLAIPLLKDDAVIGAICIYRPEIRPFTDKQIALVSTFARQAVIAIDNVRLFNETKEALEQQQASAEVLRIMSSSVADTKPVFQAILESCERLFEGRYIGIALVGEDGKLHLTAYHGRHAAEVQAHFPVPVSMDSAGGAAVLTRSVQHYPDIRDGRDVPAYARRAAEITGHRSVLLAPMLWEGKGIGTIYVCRDVPGAFSEKEIGLLETFADQAVIAIQNARLFSETKEALERQTATSEVLKVISQTRIDLQPVLETVLDNARRLCDADRVLILRPDGKGGFVPVAVRISNQASTNVDALTQRPIQLDRSTAMGRALLERRAVHIPDVLDDPDYTRRDLAVSGGFRTALSVPMLREGEPIGAMTLTRAGPPRPFTQKQIELVTTFADQAVIAIENVRLFNETTEALEQLRASAEILRVISSSVADVQPVFDTILESCERLFSGRYIGICLVGDDGMIHLSAYHGLRADELKAHFPVPLTMDSAGGAAILTRSVQHYPDLPNEPHAPEYARKAAEVTGYRSVIMAPMLWEGQGIGTIFVARETAGAFTDKEIALLTTFADQAVIAIQNARLFREINEKSRQLEVANRHKSEFLANMSHELRTPLNAIIGFTRIVMRRSKEQLEPKQYENLEKILASGQHLLQLINAILDLSKVEAGRVEVNAAEVALAPVLEQCVKTVEPLVSAPAVRLLRDFDGGLPQIYQDEEKLRQIVINLLSNAVKFTERGTVRVQAKANGESFAVAVADTGIGIPADKLEHVFEEFAQADASSTRVYGGTGLGLTIARRLARLMGGDISAESAPGVGSTFTLTLPVRYHA